MTQIPNYLRQEQKIRSLILDYALGISMIGLIPISGFLTVKLLTAIALILKMGWDIGAKWGFPKGQDFLAYLGYILGWLGALIMAFILWFIVFGMGVFIYYISSLKLAVSLFTLTWMIGQATHQFYAIGRKKLILKQDNHEI